MSEAFEVLQPEGLAAPVGLRERHRRERPPRLRFTWYITDKAACLAA